MVNWPDPCAAVIPCHNEAATIAAVVTDVRRFFDTVIVIDDGSTDETLAQARRAGAHCLRLERNQGKGVALREGFRMARHLGFNRVLTMDGDGQHCASDIPRFFNGPEADLIVGNRMLNSAGMPVIRRLVNRCLSRFLSVRAGQWFPDSQCGFRLIRLSALRENELRARRFEFESEMLVSMARAGRRISFVPVTTIYRQEQSKIRPLPDTARWLRWWFSETA